MEIQRGYERALAAIGLLARSLPVMTVGILAIYVSPISAQVNSSAILEVGHDTSPSLQNLANNVQVPQTCAQLSAQMLPNSTGLALDQNFCGYNPAPSPCPNGN